MPTYEYVCENGHVNVEVRSINAETALTECQEEDCDSTTLNRLFSPTATVFNGPGFYSRDSKTELLKPGQRVDW